MPAGEIVLQATASALKAHSRERARLTRIPRVVASREVAVP